MLSGCSLTPYKSSFQCPDVDKGKCIAVKDAYRESLNGSGSSGSKDAGKKAPKNMESSQDTAADMYKENLQKELAHLMEKPITPVIIPPKVMRVLILPYPDRSLLYMPRYVYMMINEPEWVMGNYLMEDRR